ncbi:DNA-binding transcriptional regulator, IclR family [Saccharopolyspora antimicrobica]|uniref:DNA-binding transcriptional regulator, IclR family n=1 Tax=Saccharopolyspora antimicrobica TaxID=455193 RepID=A0A1I4W5P6_9PSEU|nr:helix-turn-helix domain-containing protein [Saccharopolyspora antimicrobica]RKT87044.1 IclR family transcriptional regulator [Saccharopolyspora antimicrobica]SFN08938.1 DNA-binding transcriptional regulator, IclR family [Saccharopolyspora antimicrobica]
MAEPFATGVGVLDRSVAILDCVESNPMGTSDLARALGLTVSTAHRLATALVAHGLLRRDAAGCFHLGPRFATSALAETAQPVLAELCAETGESAQLWVRRADRRLCVVSIESAEELRASQPVGSLLPLPRGSAAQVLLGEQNPDGRGWVESVEDRAPGVGSVSAPVRLHGDTVAAVCLSAPTQRLQPSPGQCFGSQVVAAAARIEAALRS